jgi:hypothetical protein
VQIIVFNNPSEAVVRLLLANGQVPKAILRAALAPSTNKVGPAYEPTPEELEAVNDPKALEEEMFGLDEQESEAPKKSAGRVRDPNGYIALLDAYRSKKLAEGVTKVNAYPTTLAIMAQRKAAGFEESYAAAQKRIGSARTSLNIPSISNGVWELSIQE